MDLYYDRAKVKEKELISSLSTFLKSKSSLKDSFDQISNEIVSSCVSIRPPEKAQTQEKEQVIVELITMSPSGREGGRSTKPGNIVLNIRKLIEAVASGAFAAVSAYQVPWLGIFGLILLWNSLLRAVEVDLSENDAAVIWTMWVHRDRQGNEISEDELLGKVNDHLSKYERASITQKDLDFSIKNLAAIKCIKRSKRNPKNWWLREWIDTHYW